MRQFVILLSILEFVYTQSEFIRVYSTQIITSAIFIIFIRCGRRDSVEGVLPCNSMVVGSTPAHDTA